MTVSIAGCRSAVERALRIYDRIGHMLGLSMGHALGSSQVRMLCVAVLTVYGAACRLEVGTESALDRSKPLKSFIMALFAESGNYDIEARPSITSVHTSPLVRDASMAPCGWPSNCSVLSLSYIRCTFICGCMP